MVRTSGYKSRGPGFDSRLYHGDFPCGERIPVVTMVWVVSRIRFKVKTSLTKSHTSINSWLNPRQGSRWRGPHHERQPAHQLIEYPSNLIVVYGRRRKKTFIQTRRCNCKCWQNCAVGGEVVRNSQYCILFTLESQGDMFNDTLTNVPRSARLPASSCIATCPSCGTMGYHNIHAQLHGFFQDYLLTKYAKRYSVSDSPLSL